MITIDPYYDVNFYNESLQAMINNNVEYKEYILAKTPYDFYIDTKELPIMINYDILTDSMQRFIVNKVQPATPADSYLLQRKGSYLGVKGLTYYSLNKPMKKINDSEYACFFNLANRDQGIRLSKVLGPIIYFGKYYNNIRVALTYNKMIKNYVEVSDILVEKTKNATQMELVEKTKNATQMELDLNYNIFRLKDRLHKFTEQPYFKDGKYKPVKIKQFNVSI